MSTRLSRVVAAMAAAGALAGGAYTLKHLPGPASSAVVAPKVPTRSPTSTSSPSEIDAAAQSVINEATALEHRIQLAKGQLQDELQLSVSRNAATKTSKAQLAAAEAQLRTQQLQLNSESGRLAREQATLTAERSRLKSPNGAQVDDGTSNEVGTTTSTSVPAATTSTVTAENASTTTTTTAVPISTTSSSTTTTTAPATTTTTIHHHGDD